MTGRAAEPSLLGRLLRREHARQERKQGSPRRRHHPDGAAAGSRSLALALSSRFVRCSASLSADSRSAGRSAAAPEPLRSRARRRGSPRRRPHPTARLQDRARWRSRSRFVGSRLRSAPTPGAPAVRPPRPTTALTGAATRFAAPTASPHGAAAGSRSLALALQVRRLSASLRADSRGAGRSAAAPDHCAHGRGDKVRRADGIIGTARLQVRVRVGTSRARCKVRRADGSTGGALLGRAPGSSALVFAQRRLQERRPFGRRVRPLRSRVRRQGSPRDGITGRPGWIALAVARAPGSSALGFAPRRLQERRPFGRRARPLRSRARRQGSPRRRPHPTARLQDRARWRSRSRFVGSRLRSAPTPGAPAVRPARPTTALTGAATKVRRADGLTGRRGCRVRSLALALQVRRLSPSLSADSRSAGRAAGAPDHCAHGRSDEVRRADGITGRRGYRSRSLALALQVRRLSSSLSADSRSAGRSAAAVRPLTLQTGTGSPRRRHHRTARLQDRARWRSRSRFVGSRLRSAPTPGAPAVRPPRPSHCAHGRGDEVRRADGLTPRRGCRIALAGARAPGSSALGFAQRRLQERRPFGRRARPLRSRVRRQVRRATASPHGAAAGSRSLALALQVRRLSPSLSADSRSAGRSAVAVQANPLQDRNGGAPMQSAAVPAGCERKRAAHPQRVRVALAHARTCSERG